MADPFGQLQTTTPGETVLSDVLSPKAFLPTQEEEANDAAFSEGLENNLFGKTVRTINRAKIQGLPGERLTAEEATERFGAGIHQFDREVTAFEAASIVAEKQAQAERQRMIQKAGMRGTTDEFMTFGSGLLGSFTDPISAGAGLLTAPLEAAAGFSTLSKFNKLPYLSTNPVARGLALGTIEGAVGNILIEPAFIAESLYLGDDYSPIDSVLNIAMGTALGTGIGAVRGVASSIFEGAAGRMIREGELSREAVESGITHTYNSMLSGRRPTGLDLMFELDVMRREAGIQSRIARTTPIGQEAIGTPRQTYAQFLSEGTTSREAIRRMSAKGSLKPDEISTLVGVARSRNLITKITDLAQAGKSDSQILRAVGAELGLGTSANKKIIAAVKGEFRDVPPAFIKASELDVVDDIKRGLAEGDTPAKLSNKIKQILENQDGDGLSAPQRKEMIQAVKEHLEIPSAKKELEFQEFQNSFYRERRRQEALIREDSPIEIAPGEDPLLPPDFNERLMAAMRSGDSLENQYAFNPEEVTKGLADTAETPKIVEAQGDFEAVRSISEEELDGLDVNFEFRREQFSSEEFGPELQAIERAQKDIDNMKKAEEGYLEGLRCFYEES